MSKKYIVRYDRDGCIGAAACAAVAPKIWTISNLDGKADLVDGKKEKDFWVREISEEELAEHLEAAESCPVNVIHIIEKDSGKRII